MPCVPERLQWLGELACAFWEPYTYCTMLYGTSQFLYNGWWVLYVHWSQGPVRVRTAGVWICRLRQSNCLGLVNWCERFGNRTPTVQGTTGPPNFCTTACWSCKATEVKVLSRSIQLQYENAVCARAIVTAWRTGMCISLTIHLLYEVLWDLPVSVHQAVGLVWPPRSRSCTGPYNGCTLMLLFTITQWNPILSIIVVEDATQSLDWVVVW